MTFTFLKQLVYDDGSSLEIEYPKNISTPLDALSCFVSGLKLYPDFPLDEHVTEIHLVCYKKSGHKVIECKTLLIAYPSICGRWFEF